MAGPLYQRGSLHSCDSPPSHTPTALYNGLWTVVITFREGTTVACELYDAWWDGVGGSACA